MLKLDLRFKWIGEDSPYGDKIHVIGLMPQNTEPTDMIDGVKKMNATHINYTAISICDGIVMDLDWSDLLVNYHHDTGDGTYYKLVSYGAALDQE